MEYWGRKKEEVFLWSLTVEESSLLVPAIVGIQPKSFALRIEVYGDGWKENRQCARGSTNQCHRWSWRIRNHAHTSEPGKSWSPYIISLTSCLYYIQNLINLLIRFKKSSYFQPSASTGRFWGADGHKCTIGVHSELISLFYIVSHWLYLRIFKTIDEVKNDLIR